MRPGTAPGRVRDRGRRRRSPRRPREARSGRPGPAVIPPARCSALGRRGRAPARPRTPRAPRRPGPGGTCRRRQPFRSTSWQLRPATPNASGLRRARSRNARGPRGSADMLGASAPRGPGPACRAARSGASCPRPRAPAPAGGRGGEGDAGRAPPRKLHRPEGPARRGRGLPHPRPRDYITQKASRSGGRSSASCAGATSPAPDSTTQKAPGRGGRPRLVRRRGGEAGLAQARRPPGPGRLS